MLEGAAEEMVHTHTHCIFVHRLLCNTLVKLNIVPFIVEVSVASEGGGGDSEEEAGCIQQD